MSNKRKPLAQQRTSKRTDTDGYVYNPSGIPVGGTAKFKVGLDPMTGFSEDDIVWDNLGQISFVNNDNHGHEVTVRGDSTGEFFLSLAVNGMELTPIPAFFVKVMTPTTAPVTVWIVRDDNGGDAPIAESAIQPIIDDANKILKQKALTLQWSGTANYTNRTEWQDITDALNPTNAKLDALLDCSKNTGGVEFYFVKTLESTRGPLGGVHSMNGIAFAQIPNEQTMAHEILHNCALRDIYVRGTNVPPVEGYVERDLLPLDWGGGYYPRDLEQADLVKRLIMYGDGDSPLSKDLPMGKVFGISYTSSGATGEETWFRSLIKVGQEDIQKQQPENY